MRIKSVNIVDEASNLQHIFRFFETESSEVLLRRYGRWSEETRVFLSLLAKARARSETPVMRRRVEQAWRLRWGAMLACTAARAFAASLLDMRLGGGVDRGCSHHSGSGE